MHPTILSEFARPSDAACCAWASRRRDVRMELNERPVRCRSRSRVSDQKRGGVVSNPPGRGPRATVVSSLRPYTITRPDDWISRSVFFFSRQPSWRAQTRCYAYYSDVSRWVFERAEKSLLRDNVEWRNVVISLRRRRSWRVIVGCTTTREDNKNQFRARLSEQNAYFFGRT